MMANPNWRRNMRELERTGAMADICRHNYDSGILPEHLRAARAALEAK